MGLRSAYDSGSNPDRGVFIYLRSIESYQIPLKEEDMR